MIKMTGVPTICSVPGRIHRALVKFNGQLRPSRRTFKTAAEARQYRLRWKKRYERLVALKETI